MILLGPTFVIICSLFSISIAFLPSDTDSVLYDIRIGNSPKKISETQGEHVHIFSKHGQQFTCLIPNTIPKVVSQESLNNTTDVEIANVMIELKKLDCLVLVNGWWTYKVCIGKDISQYHEQNGQQSDEITLGIYSSEYQWTNAEYMHDEVNYKYHSQLYTNGTMCDVTGSPRTVQLRFSCQEQAIYPSIIEVTEPETCSYIIKIAALKFCDVSSLASEKAIISHSIACSPSLSNEAFSKYVEVKTNKNIEALLAKTAANFYNVLPKLHSLRFAAIINRLNLMRSYRKRQLKKNIQHARRFSKQVVALLRQIESNFEHITKLPNYQIWVSSNFAYLLPLRLSHSEEFSKLNSIKNAADNLKKLIKPATLNKKTILDQKSKVEREITLKIASNLLFRIRSAFEFFISNREIPRTHRMLLVITQILQNLESSKDLLPSTKVTLLKDELTLRARDPAPTEFKKFAYYEAEGYLLKDRSILKSLNASILHTQHNLHLMEVSNALYSILASHFSNYVMKFQDLEEIIEETEMEEHILTGADKIKAGPSNLIGLEQQAAIVNVLNSLPIKNKLAEINRVSKQPLQLKTVVKQTNDGLALMITVDDGTEAKNNFQENQENYQFQITEE